MNWYISVLKQYAVFTGRATRTEYWMWVLFNILIVIGLVIVETVLRKVLGASTDSPYLLTNLYSLAILLPAIGVAIRRLHDTNRSGWWMLLGFIPFVGAIVLIVFFATDSQPGPNRFGPNPKG